MVQPIRDIIPRSSASASVTEGHREGHRECPINNKPKHDVRAHRRDRSLCPWYTVNTSDKKRFPEDIIEARCSCTNCLMDHRRSSVCEPVFYPLRVLRQTGNCINGTFEYVDSWHHVPVGCTCAHRRS